MARRRWLALLVAVMSGSWPAPTEAGDAPKRPNVVILLADDMGFSDAGCYGGEIATPNLDALASKGLRYTQFYNTARCWPSRAALLTGYYAQQVNRDPQGPRPQWAALLPEMLAKGGYRSYHSGKWHVDGPVLSGGFSRSYLLLDHNRNFYPKEHELDDKPLPPVEPGTDYYTTTEITSRAIDWLDGHLADHAGDPFFLYVAYTSPHFPVQAPAEDVSRQKGRYREGWDVLRKRRWERLKSLGIVNCELSERTPGVPAWDSLSDAEKAAWESRMEVHAAMVDRIDREIGRILGRIQQAGLWDDTLILFASDNGASAEKVLRGDGHDPDAPPGSGKTFLCIEPPWANLANSPFRKSKIFVHEGGISTPLIAHWPAGIAAKGELRRAPGHFVDFAPTLLELAGVEPPDSWAGRKRPPMAGKSLVPTFADDTPIARDPLFFKHEKNRALRVGDWKIVASGANTPWELYDLGTDRAESHDLARERPGKVRELAAIWERLDAEYQAQGRTAKAP
ncbi:MAG: arylsulfatase [Isosphaeraceae bacterium]